MKIYMCGVRGSASAPGAEYVRYGGHTSCVALAHGSAAAGGEAGEERPRLVLDAGSGLRAVSGLLGGAPYKGTILLSHLHWDHSLGLPFFAAGDGPSARVHVMAPDQHDGQNARALLAGMMHPPYFPIEPDALRGEWTFATIAPGEYELEGFTVLAREIPHRGGRTLGYRVRDGHSTLAYLPDHSPTALGGGEDGWGEYHPAAIELANDADVLVHDATMFPEEFAADAGFGHAVADYAVALGARAGVGEVVLFHHRHDRTDDALDGLARRLGSAGGESSPRVSVAREGTTIEL